MKKLYFFAAFTICIHGGAFAECTGETIYVACKPGYYLESGDCKQCPPSGDVYGTTVDNNTGDITSCYLPSGTAFSDETGSGIYNTDCYYSN
ncbi:MAG: hypothetical protein IJX89_04950 [Alphaproteobacteria bacterium]|nr:hypothetical protein [Alphaproteobacteria bacterium]